MKSQGQLQALLLAALLVGIGYQPAPLTAQEKIEAEVRMLTERTALVVRGKVLEVESRLESSGGIYTYITIQPLEVLKGKVGSSPIMVRQYGGVVGHIATVLLGAPAWYRGEEVVLFLARGRKDRSPSKSGALGFRDDFVVFGLNQGKFTISRGPGMGHEIAERRVDASIWPDGQMRREQMPLESFMAQIKQAALKPEG